MVGGAKEPRISSRQKRKGRAVNVLIREFTPLVHIYFYVGVAMIAIMWVIGKKQWRRTRRAVVRQFEDRALTAVALVMGFILAVMFVTESYEAIVGWFESGATANHADSALTVSFGVIASWLGAFGLSGLVFCLVGRIASNAENGRLYIQLDEFRQEQEIKEVRRSQAKQARWARRYR